MKYIKSLILSALILAPVATHAQTNTNTIPPQVLNLWDYVTTGSNYWVVPFGTYSTDSHEWGYGIAIGYKATEVINPVMRFDNLGGKFWLSSLTAQIQPPRQLLGKIPVTPFAIAGGALTFASDQTTGGQFVSVFGAGAALRFRDLGAKGFLGHLDLVADYEYWNGNIPSNEKKQLRGGILVSF